MSQSFLPGVPKFIPAASHVPSLAPDSWCSHQGAWYQMSVEHAFILNMSPCKSLLLNLKIFSFFSDCSSSSFPSLFLFLLLHFLRLYLFFFILLFLFLSFFLLFLFPFLLPPPLFRPPPLLVVVGRGLYPSLILSKMETQHTGKGCVPARLTGCIIGEGSTKPVFLNL